MVLYPNPADGKEPVKLPIDLECVSNSVKLKLFTVAFRKINAWDYDQLPQGVYTFSIDLKDQWGTPLANGVYYLVVNWNNRRSILKLLILR